MAQRYGSFKFYSLWGGGGVVFSPLLKKSKGNPCLKILDFLSFCCGCLYEEKQSKNLALPPIKGLLFQVDKIVHVGEC